MKDVKLPVEDNGSVEEVLAYIRELPPEYANYVYMTERVKAILYREKYGEEYPGPPPEILRESDTEL